VHAPLFEELFRHDEYEMENYSQSIVHVTTVTALIPEIFDSGNLLRKLGVNSVFEWPADNSQFSRNVGNMNVWQGSCIEHLKPN